jgi:hypothetical protein
VEIGDIEIELLVEPIEDAVPDEAEEPEPVEVSA